MWNIVSNETEQPEILSYESKPMTHSLFPLILLSGTDFLSNFFFFSHKWVTNHSMFSALISINVFDLVYTAIQKFWVSRL